MKQSILKEKTLCDYLIEVVKNYRLIKEIHVREIMLKALKDYFNNQLSLNGLETIACLLNYEIIYWEDIYSYNRDLMEVLDTASDLVYYCEIENKNERNKKYCQKGLEILKSYYEKNKYLIEKNK